MSHLVFSTRSPLKRCLPVSLFSLTIFASSEFHVPGLLQDVSDQVLHLACYAFLCALAWYALGTYFPSPRHPARLTFSVVYAIFFGIVDELHQAFVPFRTPSVADITADAIGAIVAILIILFSYRNTV